MLCCRECTELVADQMQVVYDRPDDCPIQLRRCAWCGTERSCRPGWHTRCHVCLDQCTSAEHFDQDIAEILADPLSCATVRDFAHLSEDEPVTPRAVHETTSGYLLLDAIDTRARPQWTILATDLWGFPWRHDGTRSHSHGTWATHDPCGTAHKLTAGRVECRRCPPEPGSRTHRARRADPHLLYLVRYRGLIKFGHGDERRVKAHLRAGAEAVQVLRARHDEVINAELRLRAHHHAHITMGRTGMPTTFGMGTEVLPATTPIDLTDVLTGDDLTHLFRPEPSPTT
jgi:hypothetical protein